MIKFWTEEKMQALRKLAELSVVLKPSGVPMYGRNWELGFKKLETQDFAAFKLMKKIPLKSIKWMWSKHQNATYGFCSTTLCPNKIEPGHLYCTKCKPNQSRYHRGVYSNPSIKENMDVVTKAIAKKSDKDIKRLIVENIETMPLVVKRRLLGDEFREMVETKENKEKKKA